jgi:hypothetical protein
MSREIPNLAEYTPGAVAQAASNVYDSMFQEHLQDPVVPNEEGAARHAEVLARVPDGYEFYGTWSTYSLGLGVSAMEGMIVLDGPVYDNQGQIVDGLVYLAMRLPESPAI